MFVHHFCPVLLKHFAAHISWLLGCCWPSLLGLTVGSDLPYGCHLPIDTSQSSFCVAVGLVWSRALFPEKCTIGWKYGVKAVPCPWAAAYLPCVIAQPWMFLALLQCVRHWLHCPSKKCYPTWPSFLLLTSHPSVTAVPSCSSWMTPLSSFSTFCVQLEASPWLPPLLLMSLQLPSVVSDLGLMFPALSCLSAGIPWGWGEWAALDSSALVPPALLDLVLSGLCSPSQMLVFLWCVRPGVSLTQSPVLPRVPSHWFLCSFLL